MWEKIEGRFTRFHHRQEQKSDQINLGSLTSDWAKNGFVHVHVSQNYPTFVPISPRLALRLGIRWFFEALSFFDIDPMWATLSWSNPTFVPAFKTPNLWLSFCWKICANHILPENTLNEETMNDQVSIAIDFSPDHCKISRCTPTLPKLTKMADH